MPESPVTNPFTRGADAERYAKARPFFHLGVLRRLAESLDLDGALGLDVGCGTGLSSLALARYPRPRRHAPPLSDPKSWTASGFHLRHDGRDRTIVHWSQAELVDYLTTQSNVNAALAGGLDTIEGVRRWLIEATAPLFAGAPAVGLAFGGAIQCGRRDA